MFDLEKISCHGSNFEHRFIRDYDNLKEIVNALKGKGFKIVLTQGVYDLVHEGHALYLEKAKSYGDVLIVGVDSDDLTKQRKGPSRPIVPELERAKMLIHLRHVDIVTIREVSHGLGDLIKLVEPDVLIASESTKDFTKNQVFDYRPYCGKIVVLPPQATTSTTARIRNLTIDGASQLAREVNRLTEEFIKNIMDSKS